jgi:fatty-acyl-CoA synthase
MSFPLRTDHLLWRMANVHHGSEMVDVAALDRAHQAATFPKVAARARALAAGLHATYNLQHGSVVAVMAFNTRQHVELLLGVPTVGAVVECLNIRTGADVLERQLHHSRPAVVVVDAQARDHTVVGPTVEATLEACIHAGINVLHIDSRTDDGLEDLLAIGERALADPSTTGITLPELGEDDPAYLFHTSGTTGPPKTYTVTHRDAVLHALSQSTTVAANLRPDDRVLPLAPFFHVNGWGLPLTCAITGSDLVLMGADSNANQILDVLAERQVTVAAAVPTVWFDLCEAARTRPETAALLALREVLTGGSAIPDSVARAVREVLHAGVTTAWGMTETMACSTYEREDPVTSAGIPIPLVEARIVQPIDATTTDGRGRLEIRGAFIVGSHTRDTGPDGWMDTGDVASVDDAGRIHLHDRQKDLIKSGGEWIVSADLEQALCVHPAVSTAAVVARPDPRWMERPVAFVVLREDVADVPAPVDLREFLADSFPKWWLPAEITIAGHLPRTPVGKIDKVALRRAQQPAATAVPADAGHPNAVAFKPNNSEVVA